MLFLYKITIAWQQIYIFQVDFQKAAFGHKGLRILGSGESSVGGEKFLAIQVVADAQVDFTSSAGAGDTTITNLVLEAGFIIYGTFDFYNS